MPLVNNKVEPLELPSEKHARVIFDGSKKWRYRVLRGGRNGYKDWSFAAAAIERGVRVSTRFLFTREVQMTIADSAHRLLSDTIKRLGYQKYFTVLQNSIKCNVNETHFVFRGLNDLVADDIKSMEGIDVCVICEAQSLTKKSFTILDPTIRKAGSEIWIMYNTGDETDFVYDFTVTNPPENLIGDIVNYTDTNAPDKMLSPEIREQAQRCKRECEASGNMDPYNNIWLGQPRRYGLFFTKMPEREEPGFIEPSDLNLFGSFDFGSSEVGHSSFGMWHVDHKCVPHRLFTWYHKLGHTAGAQASELVDYVRSFPHTAGKMPKRVFSDPAIFAKRKEIGINATPKSVADYFQEVGFNMVPAINNRKNGWIVMKDYFDEDPSTKLAKIKVWNGYNEVLFDCLRIQKEDENNPGDIAANDHDHVVDECRYGLMAFRSEFVPNKAKPKTEYAGFPTSVFCGGTKSSTWMG